MSEEVVVDKNDIKKLIKYRSSVNQSKLFTFIGIMQLFLAPICFFILGPALASEKNFQNIGYSLIEFAPTLAVFGGLFVAIALPIWLISSIMYNNAKKNTCFDSEKSLRDDRIPVV